MKHFSAVLVTHNHDAWLATWIGSIEAIPPDSRPRILVVDNASSDGSVAVAHQMSPDATFISSPVNLGFAGGVNLGIRQVHDDVVVLLNPDVTVDADTLPSLARAFDDDPRVAIAGCKLLYPDRKTIQHAGGRITYPLALADHFGYGEEDVGQLDDVREVDYVTGAVFAVRRSVLEEIGYFDEGFFPAYFEEADLCYRARQNGYKVLYVPQAVAIHHESVTTGRDTFSYYHFYHRNRIRYVLKHYQDDQLWRDFLPAEVERLQGLGRSTESIALGEAYRDNLAVLEGRATFFANPPAVAPLPSTGGRARLVWILANLVDRIQSGDRATMDPASKPDTTRESRIAALRRLSTLTEPSFVSSVPVVGSLIVRVRTLWNSVSTKWYVRSVIQQQNAFNSLVVDLLERDNLEVQAPRDSLRPIETAVAEAERLAVAAHREVARLELRLHHRESAAQPGQRDLPSHDSVDPFPPDPR